MFLVEADITVGAGPLQGKDMLKIAYKLQLAMLEVLIKLRG